MLKEKVYFTIKLQNLKLEQVNEKKIFIKEENFNDYYYIVSRILYTVYEACIVQLNRLEIGKCHNIELRNHEMLIMNGIIICFPNCKMKCSLFDLLFTSIKKNSFFIDNRIINLTIDYDYLQLSENLQTQIFLLDFLYNLNMIQLEFNLKFKKVNIIKNMNKIKFFYNKFVIHFSKFCEFINKSQTNFLDHSIRFLKLKVKITNFNFRFIILKIKKMT